MNEFPDDCIQAVTPGAWWVRDDHSKLGFGSLVWSHVPYFDLIPYRLTASRADPYNHTIAKLVAEPLYASKTPADKSPLPVAGLPSLQGAHGWVVNRMKKRPCLVLVEPAREQVDRALTHGMGKSATNNFALVAPYYGVDQNRRGGYNPSFVEKIKHATFPQWFWDMLPFDGAEESILRLDQAHPAGDHHQTYKHTGYALGDDAKKVMREWLEWHLGFKPSEVVQDFTGFIADFHRKP